MNWLMALLLLATVNGQIAKFNTETLKHEVVFQSSDDEPLMGISQHEEMLFVASLNRVFRLNRRDFSLQKKTRRYIQAPGFHQMNYYKGKLYTTATTKNQIWVYDQDLRREQKINIQPPNPGKRVKYKKNYNHINNIVLHENTFYINLNWLSNRQFSESGVLKMDMQFKEIGKFEYAWESHDFQFADGKMIAICSTSSRDKKILHPFTSGLMVEGRLAWEHNPDESFCKALCFDKRYFYFCGGKKALRNMRKDTEGIIYVIDRNTYELVKKVTDPQLKGIKGALIHESK